MEYRIKNVNDLFILDFDLQEIDGKMVFTKMRIFRDINKMNKFIAENLI